MRQIFRVLVVLLLIYLLITWVLGIFTGSWMCHIVNTDSWKNALESSAIGESVTTQILQRSWSKNPFIDVYLTTDNSCPKNYTDELIYDIWPGTRAMCDCLQRSEGGRDYYRDSICGGA